MKSANRVAWLVASICLLSKLLVYPLMEISYRLGERVSYPPRSFASYINSVLLIAISAGIVFSTALWLENRKKKH